MLPPPPRSTLFPYTTLFRSELDQVGVFRAPDLVAFVDEVLEADRVFLLVGNHERAPRTEVLRSEEHTSELQSRFDLVCRLLLEKKNKHNASWTHYSLKHKS